VTHVNPEIVTQLIAGGFIPIIAPVAVDHEGASLNVNADTVAGKVAEALHAEKLVLMTDIAGVKGREGALLSSLSADEARALERDGIIDGGMIPKVECALEALAGGVKKVHVIDGRVKHAMLLEIFTDRGLGTEITR
jgi:acetylglutamate kinase